MTQPPTAMIECIPNVSEGRDPAKIAAMVDAIRATPDVWLLNTHSDPDHNRSVLTYASDSGEAIRIATMSLFEVAVRTIDLRQHHGAHPRVGAVDVVPFVPLPGSTMSECVEIAKEVGQEIAERFGIPVYLYEEAAERDDRRGLPAIRSGGFEKFGQKIADDRWIPDFGPRVVHPTAGVSVVGARVPLIAFNVQLDTLRVEVARQAARAVRAISGGLPYVRALPIELKTRGIVQVSMNLLDYRKTPIVDAFKVVEREAARLGVAVLSSEIVGLVPAKALDQVDQAELRIAGFRKDMVLEERIRIVTGR